MEKSVNFDLAGSFKFAIPTYIPSRGGDVTAGDRGGMRL